jgi:hypothetical protein
VLKIGRIFTMFFSVKNIGLGHQLSVKVFFFLILIFEVFTF